VGAILLWDAGAGEADGVNLVHIHKASGSTVSIREGREITKKPGCPLRRNG